jgi:ribosomal protein S18 acetylase RimI-like enzyme
MIALRPLTLSDEPFLWEMLYQALYVPPGHPPFPPEIVSEPVLRRYVEAWGQPDDFGIVATDARRSVGAAWCRQLVGTQRGYGYVDEVTPELSMAVLPEYRGRGIGGRLLAALITAAEERYPALCLSVSAHNPARRLYERAGFIIVAASGDTLTMRRPLP